MIHVYSMKLYAYFLFHFSNIMLILHKWIPISTFGWKQYVSGEYNAIIHHSITCEVLVPGCIFSAEALFVLK